MKTKERIKTILIYVLLFGAVFFTYLIWGNFTKNTVNTIIDDGVVAAVTEQRHSRVVPFAVSCKNQKGRIGAAYHGGSVSTIFDKVSPIITQALKTVKKAELISEEDWLSAIKQQGILIDFEGNVPLTAFCDRMGVNYEEKEIFFRYMQVTTDALYLKNGEDGKCHKMDCVTDSESVMNVLDGLSASKCTLAAEAGNTRVSPETMMFDGNISAFTVRSVDVVDEFDDTELFALLKIFGMNYNTCGRHVEADGSRTYIQELATLKIMPDGYILYETEDDDGANITIKAEGEIPTMREKLEGAEQIIQSLEATTGGEASLYIKSADDGAITYGRSFGGIPVDRSESGYSARVEFSGNSITGLGFYMRAYSGNGIVSLLPQKLAIASSAQNSGRVLSLRYADSGIGSIDAQWYFKQ